MVGLGAVGLVGDQLAKLPDVLLAQTGGSQVRNELLQDQAGLEDLVDAGADVDEVHRHGVGDRPWRRREHHESAARSPSHAGNLQVLEEADRLAEDGAADAVALEELGLGADDLAHRPAGSGDVADHPVGNRRGEGRALLPLTQSDRSRDA